MPPLRLCEEIAQYLAERRLRVVFAESCTAGLVSASLARVPGISEHLCGSAVTYRTQTKHAWLNVDAELLTSPGPVSEIVAARMASAVLAKTKEADLALSVTGHLGPHAPENLDGQIYIGVVARNAAAAVVYSQRLTAVGREARQREAASGVLSRLLESLRVS